MTNSQCPQCGFLDAVASEFCHKCGAELSPRVRLHASPEFNRSTDDRVTTDGRYVEPALIQPFYTISSVLSPTIKLYSRNLFLISKIIFVVFAPYEILKATTLSAGQQNFQSVAIIGLMFLLCKALVAPALIYALVVQIDTGRTPTLSESYRWGLGRLGPLMLAAVCAWIAAAAGTIALVIPGIILSMAFVVVYPMVTLEGGGPIDVLKRSYELTNGYKAQIFGASFVIGLLYFAATVPLGAVSLAAGLYYNYWPVTALISVLSDIVTESYSVFALVVYLSLARNSYQRVNLAVPEAGKF